MGLESGGRGLRAEGREKVIPMCVCVNKRDVENETREIIVENKLWCINVALSIFDQIILKNGQLFSLSLKKKFHVKDGSNSLIGKIGKRHRRHLSA